MPMYEYACHSCGYTLEARQKFSDAPLRTCPSCHAEALERLISESSFALKGSGWYADGYGPSGSKKSDANTGSSTTASTAPKADEKASKPAAESAPKPEKKESKPVAKSD